MFLFTRYFILITLFCLICVPVFAEPFFFARTEVYQIKIENKAGGSIEVSSDLGTTWQKIGKVITPTEKVSTNGFAASRWVNFGEVAATAVNAIHIKAGSGEGDTVIFSLLPVEFQKSINNYRSFLSSNSSIYTDIKAGTKIFGGGLASFVGNTVLVSQPDIPQAPMPKNYCPKIGETIYIVVEKPVNPVRSIIFENRFGGAITLNYFNGTAQIVGQVLRPVQGIGRFEGSVYNNPGRIRANHPGVIDISVSPYGSLGGFQIIPATHGSDLEFVKDKTQWMIVGPVDLASSLEGTAPLFSSFLQPDYRPDDILSPEWENKMLDRFLVQVKYKGEDSWRPMPIFSLRRDQPLPRWANLALDKVSQIRILFPINN